jgi:hypothetical protein
MQKDRSSRGQYGPSTYASSTTAQLLFRTMLAGLSIVPIYLTARKAAQHGLDTGGVATLTVSCLYTASCLVAVAGLLLICSTYDFRHANYRGIYDWTVPWWKEKLVQPAVVFSVVCAFPRALQLEPMGYNNYAPSFRARALEFWNYWPRFGPWALRHPLITVTYWIGKHLVFVVVNLFKRLFAAWR